MANAAEVGFATAMDNVSIDSYQMLDIVVRCVLFIHLVYSVVLWCTSSGESDDSSPTNLQDALNALDGLFSDLLTEVDNTTRIDDDRVALKRLLTTFRSEISKQKTEATRRDAARARDVQDELQSTEKASVVSAIRRSSAKFVDNSKRKNAPVSGAAGVVEDT